MATAVNNKIGNSIWDDKNGNGIQDAGELGISGMTVSLYSKAENGVWTNIYTTIANSQGFYEVSNFADGDTLRVQYSLPVGYAFTTSTGTLTDTNNSDVTDAANGFTKEFVASNSNPAVTAPGGDNTDYRHDYIDAGVYKLASISGLAWNDANMSNGRDPSEKLLSGVTASLFKVGTTNAVATMTTQADGSYSFNNLAPGQYRVQFAYNNPNITSFSTPKAIADTTKDSDVNNTGSTEALTLNSGDVLSNIDAGLRGLALGGKVWQDLDPDGLKGSNEPGAFGIVATLCDKTGKPILDANNKEIKTATDNDGNYQFTNLAAGDYTVKFSNYSNIYITTRPSQDKTGNAGSDINPATGLSKVITLSASSMPSTNFGIFPIAQTKGIGDFVWNDINKNGIQEHAEMAGVANVTVKLSYADGTAVAEKTTDSSGHYAFNRLLPVGYKVQFVAPTGYALSPKNATDNADADSNPDPTTGLVDAVVDLGGSGDIHNLDAGLYATGVTPPPPSNNAIVQGHAWNDANRDGLNNTTETAITTGLTVKLLNSAGNTVAGPVAVDASGNYKFANLAAGNYAVQFTNSNTNYQFTTQAAGTNRSIDSDVDASGKSAQITLAAGQTVNVDAGLVTSTAKIGNFVWLDTNGNGAQDNGELGLNGVTVHLFKSGSTTEVANIKTTALNGKDGFYQFDNIATGDYYLKFDAPDSSYSFTGQDKANDAIDSDADATGKTAVFKLTADNLSMDAGLMRTASVSSFVWDEKLQAGQTVVNGIRDAGEVGCAGAKVELFIKTNKAYVTTNKIVTTGEDGAYNFGGLQPGDYALKFSKADYLITYKDQGGNEAKDSDADQSSGFAYFSLKAGEQNTTVGAGMAKAAKIGDLVWADHMMDWSGGDKDRNGLQDPAEPRVKDKGMLLVDVMGNHIASTTTDAKGVYSFQVLPGTYQVHLESGGFSFMTTFHKGDGKYGDRDSDFAARFNLPNDPHSKSSEWITVGLGEDYKDLDLGITPLAIDLNHNGIQTLARNDIGFDLTGNGTALRSGWLSGEDGFLAIDNNQNGKIDNIHELFGGTNKGDGFAKLAEFDSNQDGFVNAQDARFAELVIWQDANSNKVTDAGELSSLTEAGVTSLSVNYVAIPELDENGNLHLERSSALLADGSAVNMTDVYFAVSQADAQTAGVVLPSMAELLSNDAGLDMFNSPSAMPISHHDSGYPTVLQQMGKFYDDASQLVM